MSKFIPLKVIHVLPDTDFEYRNLLCDIIVKAADAKVGMDIAEVKQSMRVARAIGTCEAPTCELSDEDYAFVLRKVKAVRWQIATPHLVQFLEDVVQE